mgnify:CR=1 FL=1
MAAGTNAVLLLIGLPIAIGYFVVGIGDQVPNEWQAGLIIAALLLSPAAHLWYRRRQARTRLTVVWSNPDLAEGH